MKTSSPSIIAFLRTSQQHPVRCRLMVGVLGSICHTYRCMSIPRSASYPQLCNANLKGKYQTDDQDVTYTFED